MVEAQRMIIASEDKLSLRYLQPVVTRQPPVLLINEIQKYTIH